MKLKGIDDVDVDDDDEIEHTGVTCWLDPLIFLLYFAAAIARRWTIVLPRDSIMVMVFDCLDSRSTFFSSVDYYCE